MNATTHDKLLATRLKLLHAATPRKAPVPIFGCILLEPAEEGVRLTAGDMEHFVQTHTTAIEGVERPVAVQADLLHRTLAMIEGDYSLRIENERLIIETDSGRYSSITFDGEEYLTHLPSEDFELLFEMDGEEARWLLQGLEHILNEKGYREMFRYALLQPQSAGYMAYATQGQILVAKQIRARIYNPLRFLLPVGIVKLLRSAIGNDQPVRFGRMGSYLACEVDGYRFFYRDVELPEIPFEQVLNASQVQGKALVPVDALSASLNRLARFNDQNAVDLELTSEHLVLRAADEAEGEARETLPDVQHEGNASIRVNARFLLALLSTLSASHVELRFGQPTQPLLLTSDEGRTRAALAPIFKD